MSTGSNRLTEIIRNEISAKGGRITFARFMELALYHPEHGYYTSPDFTLGKLGDFTTAPEISPLFTQCLAKQCEQILSSLPQSNILELGAGTGRLAADLLKALEKSKHLPQRYFIYEISQTLRQKQKSLLTAECPDLAHRVAWLEQLPTNFDGVIIANEVLDALPVHRFRCQNNQIDECFVAWSNDQFIWTYSKPSSTQLNDKIQHIRDNYIVTENYESEINLSLENYVAEISNCLSNGVILFIDYGYGQREYYHPQRNKGSLTCFYKHQRHDNPLLHPGAQDITAHVDFTAVVETATEHGCEFLGFTTQASFLLDCGLIEIAQTTEQSLSEVEAFQLHQAIKTLTLPTEMGELIKVMALGKNSTLDLLGFQMADRSRDL